MTYLQLCQAVKRELGISGTLSTVSGVTGQLERLVNWVADAAYEVENRWADWDFLWTQYSSSITAGNNVPSTDKPTDLGDWDLDSFFIDYTSTTYRQLERLDYRHWRNVYGAGTQPQDIPSHFAIKPDGTVVTYPAADATYTVTADYWKTPTKMTADANTPLIPTQYQRIIVARAKYYYGHHEDAQEIINAAGEEYTEILARLEANQLPDKRDRNKARADELSVVVVE